MRIPAIRGVIERRILANWRVDPAALARVLPPPFRPQVVDGVGIAGVCLIRLKQVRPLLRRGTGRGTCVRNRAFVTPTGACTVGFLRTPRFERR